MRYVVGFMMFMFPLAGIILIQLSLRRLWTNFTRWPFLFRAEAEIIKVIRKDAIRSADDHSGPRYAFYPVLRFQTAFGEFREFQSESGQGGDQSPYQIGSKLPVLYDPDNLMPPVIYSWGALWFIELVMILGGLLFCGAGATIYFCFGAKIFGREPI
jgi:hypothetical protein